MKKENVTTPPTTFRFPYEIRVDLVKDAIRDRTKLSDKDAKDLAVHVLHVLGSIPEKVR